MITVLLFVFWCSPIQPNKIDIFTFSLVVTLFLKPRERFFFINSSAEINLALTGMSPKWFPDHFVKLCLSSLVCILRECLKGCRSPQRSQLLSETLWRWSPEKGTGDSKTSVICLLAALSEAQQRKKVMWAEGLWTALLRIQSAIFSHIPLWQTTVN